MNRYEAYIQKNWREQAPVPVLVVRIREGDRVEVGYFWIDRFCLGVRHALYDNERGEADFRALLDQEIPADERESIHPAWAKAFIEGAIAYAEQFGFAPNKDYRKARRVLSGIDASLCSETFIYGGAEGKPLYIETDADSPERTERVLAQLETHCGHDGFDYDLLDTDDDDEEPMDPSVAAARAGLMAYFGTDDSALSFYEFSGMVVGMLSSPVCPSTSELIEWTAQPERRQPKDLAETQVYFDHLRVYWNALLPAIADCHDGPLDAPDAPIDIQPEDFPEDEDPEKDAELTLYLHILWCRGFMNTTRLWPEAWGDLLTRPDLAPAWAFLSAWDRGDASELSNLGENVIPGDRPLCTALRTIIRASPRRPLHPSQP